MKLGTTSWLTGENFLDNARLVEGQADFVELLVYTWGPDMRAKVSSWLDKLAALKLEYTVHLPTDTVEHALDAACFFRDSGFPVLNMTLHPLPGWQEVKWPVLTSLENLIDRVEMYPRFTFDLTHSLLGQPLPRDFFPQIVELHLSGTDGHPDHLPLDEATLHCATPYLNKEILVCLEIFDVEDALRGLELVRSFQLDR